MIELNEKYLYECDNSDPFYVLLFEGVYGFILSFVYALFYNPLKTIKDFKKSKTSSEFIILILSLIIYIVLSAMKNLYRVNTTKIFSSMTTVIFEYIFNPIYFIIKFSLSKDFIIRGQRNFAYFFINLIIGIIISFFSLVFNEFIILLFCKLDKDTHFEISIRAINEENFIGDGSISNRSSIASRYNDNNEESVIYHFKY